MSVDDRFRAQFMELSRQRQEQRGHLPPHDGGGTSGGVTDDWKASVDRQLEQLHGDVRSLANKGIAAAIGLAAMIAGLYLYTNQKFDGVSAKFDGVNGRFEGVGQRLGAIEVQQAKIDAKLDRVLERLPAPRK